MKQVERNNRQWQPRQERMADEAQLRHVEQRCLDLDVEISVLELGDVAEPGGDRAFETTMVLGEVQSVEVHTAPTVTHPADVLIPLARVLEDEAMATYLHLSEEIRSRLYNYHVREQDVRSVRTYAVRHPGGCLTWLESILAGQRTVEEFVRFTETQSQNQRRNRREFEEEWQDRHQNQPFSMDERPMVGNDLDTTPRTVSYFHLIRVVEQTENFIPPDERIDPVTRSRLHQYPVEQRHFHQLRNYALEYARQFRALVEHLVNGNMSLEILINIAIGDGVVRPRNDFRSAAASAMSYEDLHSHAPSSNFAPGPEFIPANPIGPSHVTLPRKSIGKVNWDTVARVIAGMSDAIDAFGMTTQNAATAVGNLVRMMDQGNLSMPSYKFDESKVFRKKSFKSQRHRNEVLMYGARLAVVRTEGLGSVRLLPNRSRRCGCIWCKRGSEMAVMFAWLDHKDPYYLHELELVKTEWQREQEEKHRPNAVIIDELKRTPREF